MMEFEICPVCRVLVPKGDACQDGDDDGECPMGDKCPGPMPNDDHS